MSILDNLVHEMLNGKQQARADFACPDCGASAHLRIQHTAGASHVIAKAWCEVCEDIRFISSLPNDSRDKTLIGKRALIAIGPRLVAECVSQSLSNSGFDFAHMQIAKEAASRGGPLGSPHFIIADFDFAQENGTRWSLEHRSTKVLLLSGHGNRLEEFESSSTPKPLQDPYDRDWIANNLAREVNMILLRPPNKT